MNLEENKSQGELGSTSYSPEKLEQQSLEEQKRREEFINACSGVNWKVLLPTAFLTGVLLCNGVFRGGSGFGMAVACAAFLICVLAFGALKKKSFDREALLPATALIVLELSFCISSSSYGRGWLVLFAVGLVALTASSLSGCLSGSPLEPACFSDVLAVFTSTALSNIRNTAAAIKAKYKAKAGRKKGLGNAGKIIVGIIIALPVAALLLAAFSCADSAFGAVTGDLLEKLLDCLDFLFTGEPLWPVLDIAFGTLAIIYLVPLTLTLRQGKQREKEAREPRLLLDGIICATVCFVAAAVYIFFIVFQFRYFFSVSLSYFISPSYDVSISLPGGVSWAEYARSGFFELSAIIGVTFAVIVILTSLCKRGEDGSLPCALRVALTVIAACDLVLVVSCALRMRLYTIWCGLTGLRIAVLIAVFCFALCLVAAIIKLWYEKLRLMRFITVIALLGICAFACMNVDRLCAQYNVNRHLEQNTSIDIEYLGTLSCAAAPSVKRLMEESDDPLIRTAAKGILAKYQYYGDTPGKTEPLDERRWGAQTADTLRALNICGNYELEPDDVDSYFLYACYQQETREALLAQSEALSYEQWLEQYDGYPLSYADYGIYCGY